MASDPVDAGPLTVADEQRLCARVQAGDNSAVHELVLANIKLCTYLAKPYVIDGVDLQDLIQEARLAMLKAAETYDARRGRFAHYAGYFIRKGLARFMAEQGSTIWMSRNRYQSIAVLERAEAELSCVLERAPEDQEICEHLSWKPLVLKRVRAASAMRKVPCQQEIDNAPMSLESDNIAQYRDNPDDRPDTGIPLDKQVAGQEDDPSYAMEFSEDAAKLKVELQKLRPRTRRILLRHMAGDSLSLLNRKYQLGTDVIKEIIAIGLKQLRQAMDAD